MLSQRTCAIGPNPLPRTAFRGAWLALSLLAGLALSGCTSTQVRTATDASGKPEHIVGTVVLVEPDIELYAVGAGGMQEPREAWTLTARREFPIAARDILQAQGVPLKGDFMLPKDAGPENKLRQLTLLNQAVSISILSYARGDALRNKHGKFDWTLGPGVAALREATGADYALFTYIRDSYTSGGRAAMRIIGFLLLGGDVGGGMQIGLASLVDLRTGQVVWHNLLLDQTGDLRDPKGAHETAGDLLRGIRR
ncbi:hypothetical protein LYSHEL_04680 [Lysobacter helvus]|uniref:Lipoprotein n=2 Tax=Lysobacteraceae TaxID=32033 RepID=A0ABN6FPC1_9GAMM|nr:hypothetical protein LYSCAS_04680 [Lysobacter caseinilyticus]BCT94597.1 hypothetical protein LYSHEL_04680 [Lysobacter helvus]